MLNFLYDLINSSTYFVFILFSVFFSGLTHQYPVLFLVLHSRIIPTEITEPYKIPEIELRSPVCNVSVVYAELYL